MWEDQRIVARPALPRPDLARCASSRARSSSSAMHVHVGHRRPRQGDPRRQRHARPPAGPAGAERELAVLARRLDRPDVDAHADLPRLPARGDPARTTTTGRTTSAQIAFMVDSRRDGGLHLPLVRRPPAPAASAPSRSASCDAPDARRAHARPRRADPGDGQGAVRALRLGRAAVATTRGEMLDENKWLAARHGLDGELVDLPSRERVGTARAGPPAGRPPARARPGPRLGATSSTASRTCSPRQRRRAPGRRLRGQPRPARGHGRDRRPRRRT